jgi:hypothetical protein
MMRIWAGPRRGMDRGIHTGWLASAKAAGLTPGTLLAWELTDDRRYCIASAGLLSLSSSDPSSPDWRHIGWQQIERGGYDSGTDSLHWQLYDAAADERVRLEKPGRLPEVFRDRVAASIAVEQFIAVEGARKVKGVEPGVIISGRRDLSRPESAIEWRASLPRGLDWDTPGLRDLAEDAIARLSSEYGP